MPRLPLGKLPSKVLQESVLSFLGIKSKEVEVGPGIGIDFAAIRVGDSYLIVSCDPVTGALDDVGWYAVNVSANDVATSGVAPRFMESAICLPPASDDRLLTSMARQMHEAASGLGVTIVGGHTEVTESLDHPLVTTTCFGIGKKFVSSSQAKANDSILMTKTAGIEGTSILAQRFRPKLQHLGQDLLSSASMMIRKISIVREGLVAYRTRLVHGMHDPTEGGLLGGVYEMSVAAGLGFTIWGDRIPVADETRQICRTLSVDPLRLIGSGSLLMAVDPSDERKLTKVLRSKGIQVSNIGQFREPGSRRRLIMSGDKIQSVDEAPCDELWRLLTG